MVLRECASYPHACRPTCRRNPVPKHVHEARPIDPRQRSEPKDPKAIFEPFQLASLELHAKKVSKVVCEVVHVRVVNIPAKLGRT